MKQKQASQREASPSWLSIWTTIATVFGLLPKAGFLFLQRISLSSGSAQYERWRDRLLRDRLQLIVRIALFVTLITLSVEFVTAGFSISRRVVLYGAVALSLYVCYSLRKTSLGRNRPGLVFLGICWSITLIPGLEHWLERSDLPNLNLWTLTFLVNVLLVPVYWTLHVLSQLSVIAFYVGMEWLNPNYSATFGQSLQQILYLFWVGFICDLSVYLHEQFQRNEIESKHTQRMPAALYSLLQTEPRNEPIPDLIWTRNDRPTSWQQWCDRYLQHIKAWLSAYITSSEKQSTQCYTSDLNAVVQKTIVQLEPTLLEHDTSVTNAVPSSLPPVTANSAQLQFVLENLINDALERNSDSIHLILTAEVIAAEHRDSSPMVRCTIQDDGVKIQSEQDIAVADLTDQSADSLLEWQIGLNLSEPIIRSQGGEIGTVINRQDGTMVWFTLPIATSHQSLSNLT